MCFHLILLALLICIYVYVRYYFESQKLNENYLRMIKFYSFTFFYGSGFVYWTIF